MNQKTGNNDIKFNGTEPSLLWQIITLSGRTIRELQEAAEYCKLILSCADEESLQTLSHQLNQDNHHNNYRLAVVANTANDAYKQVQQQLSSLENVQLDNQNEKCLAKSPIAFLFSGGGAQYVGMGKYLYETEPVFRKTIDYYNHVSKTILPIQLLDILYPAQLKDSVIDDIAYLQPALFAFELALFKLWKSWGIMPDVVMGHSLGEYAAACAAGVFSEEDGFMLTARRGQLMQKLSGDTLMIAVFADLMTVREVIEEYLEKVSIAAENGPMVTVISGAAPQVREACECLKSADIKMHQLNIARAGHSVQMEPIMGKFRKIVQDVQMKSPKIKLVSNLTGQLVGSQVATVKYWCRHTRETVHFKSGMDALAQLGVGCYIEVGPQPVLLTMGQECINNQVDTALWLASVGYKETSNEEILRSLAKLYVAKFPANWSKVFGL